MARYRLVAEDGFEPERIDRFIASRLAELSRNRIQHLIREGLVLLNGEVCKPSDKVRSGDQVEIEVPPAQKPHLQPQPMELDIRYEDEHIIVINKPAGVVVHPGAGNPDGTLVNALIHHCPDIRGVGGVMRPGVVHRLDKGTSGLLVFSKTDDAHKGLVEQFKAHSIERAYRALAYGVPQTPEGIITSRIGRHPRDRKRFASVQHRGKYAMTRWSVLETYCGELSLFELVLETGRTHQIRVHLSEFGHPVVGDPVYGQNRRRLARLSERTRDIAERFDHQALHAYRLGFRHPITGEWLRFEAELPDEFASAIEELRKRCSQ